MKPTNEDVSNNAAGTATTADLRTARARVPRKWLFFGVFLLLALASNAVRHFREPEPPPEGAPLATREFAAGKNAAGATATAGTATAGTSAAAPVLFIHSAWGDGSALAPLAERVAGATGRRVIVPDLPGAGASAWRVSDYSGRAAAEELAALLDAKHVAGAHVVAFGQGGAAAVELARLRPAAVRSLALVSSVGAQEFDLLGNHIVNKIVFTFHLAFTRLAEVALPHFGALDRSPVNARYARVFWDGDLTVMKPFLGAYRGPLFLAHGEDDWVVAADTARYTKEIAPQAETFFTAGGHWVFEHDAAAGNELAQRLGKFFTSAEKDAAGNAAAGSTAGNAVKPAAGNALPRPQPAHGARMWVLMVIIILCAFVAEDPTCLASGLLVANGVLSFTAATTACLISILIGDFTLYLVGYTLGRPALRVPPLRWILPEYKIDRMAGWFEKKGFQGLLLIVTSRFIPASRLPTFVSAGIMRLSLWRLGILFFVAAALWTPPLVWVAWHLSEKLGGDAMFERFEVLKHNAMWVALGLLFGFWFLMHVLVPALTWRGRRRIVARMRRRRHHEFWRDWLLYAPVAGTVIWNALRRFNLGGVAAANPALGSHGGFTGSAKSEMLGVLEKGAGSGERGAGEKSIARFARIPAGENSARLDALRRFMRDAGVAFPIVLKPDTGDDGLGVNRIAGERQAAEWFEHFREDALAQEWVAGDEFEVLWCRRPGETRGRLLSVCTKTPPAVTGDGRRALEDLILADDSLVADADLLLRFNWQRAEEVLPAGERAVLSDIGTAACGSRVKEISGAGSEVCERFAAALDALADGVFAATGKGLHYAAFDVRLTGTAATTGTGTSTAPRSPLPVPHSPRLVITGVSGACTVGSLLRDPALRLRDALRAVRAQITECFAIADAVRAAGSTSTAAGRPLHTASGLALLAARAEARGRHLIDLHGE